MFICYNTSMKNKTLKNLIAFGFVAIFLLGFDFASASVVQPYNSSWTIPVTSSADRYYYEDAYNPNYYNSSYGSNYNQNYNSGYNNGYGSSQYGYNQQQPNTYTQPQVQYIQQPAQIKYVPVETIKYVNTSSTSNTQGASVARSNSNTTVARNTTTVNRNTGVTGNTGQYVNYDPNTQGMMLASAYGAYNGQQVVNSGVVYDDNGVTALTVKGSGGFMPSSVFQWFMLVLIILAIVIVARMVSKTYSHGAHGAPAH